MDNRLRDTLNPDLKEILGKYCLCHLSLRKLASLRNICRAWRDLADSCDGNMWLKASTGLIPLGMVPSGEASSLALQQILRFQGRSLAMVHLGAVSSVFSVSDADFLDWTPCCQSGGVTARLSELSKRLEMAIHPGPAEVPTLVSSAVIRLLRLVRGRPANIFVSTDADDLVLFPQDGMSVVLVHDNLEEQRKPGVGNHPAFEATATSLSLARHDLSNNGRQPIIRHEPNLTLARAFPDHLGRFIGLLRQQQDGSTLIMVVRMSNLADQSLLQVDINLQESDSRGITWTFVWAPDSSLAALWPMRQHHLQSQTLEALQLVIFRAHDGQKLHSIALGKPLVTAGLPQDTQVAWSPDAQQLAFLGHSTQRNCLSTPEVGLLDVATGALQAWLKLPWPNCAMLASCYSLRWASSSQWLVAAAHYAPNGLPMWAEVEMYFALFAVDASNGAILCDFPGTGYPGQTENFMGVNGLFNEGHMSSDLEVLSSNAHARIHASDCGSALANAHSSRHQMQCTWHSRFDEPFKRELASCNSLAANGEFLIGVMDVSEEFDGDFAAEPEIDDCEAEYSVVYHYLPAERVAVPLQSLSRALYAIWSFHNADLK
ncbi:hypothetical protein WJX74_003310 [Apatococcus lobatus]|uniref:F-box domain-containing protein n=1 Tax=Apatococcus lobatus TaxID=904363 RepID=A0AAW1QUK3_9CHLO